MPELFFYTTILFSVATIVALIMYTLKTCPPIPRVKALSPADNIVPTIDLQFSESNFPSVQYNDLFTGTNVWQGGYMLTGSRGTNPAQNGVSTRPVVSISGYVPSG